MARTRVVLIAAVAALAACGEKPQSAGQERKSDVAAWQGTGDAYSAAGWKSGDKASWEAQLRQRAQTQNEYLRAPAKP